MLHFLLLLRIDAVGLRLAFVFDLHCMLLQLHGLLVSNAKILGFLVDLCCAVLFAVCKSFFL
jgi:hypothetical protein